MSGPQASQSSTGAEFFAGLPTMTVGGPVTTVHGSLRVPWVKCLLDTGLVNATSVMQETRDCLVGYSYYSFFCREKGGLRVFEEFTGSAVSLLEQEHWIIILLGAG